MKLISIVNGSPAEPIPNDTAYTVLTPAGLECYTAGERPAVAHDAAKVASIEAEKTKYAADAAAAASYAKLQSLIAMSPAQVQAWVTANVTNITQAQDAIATLAIAVSVLARRL